MSTIAFAGNFIGNEFRFGKLYNEWQKHSPSDVKDLVFEAKESLEDVDFAVESARNAFSSWARLSQADRNQYLLRLSDVFVEMKDEIAECISRETGKPLWETLGEAAALSGKIKITLEHSLKRVQEERFENAQPNVDAYIRYRPRGVMAVLGPFNFPAHLPNGHIVPSLATGNTVVLKPSEITPATGQLYAKAFQRAEFPKGVFNLVQGQVEVGKKLVRHQDVDGVLFTGSYDVGLKISKDILEHYWKISALEMGGKNASIVWEDADLDKALYDNLFGAYASTGQRCSCTSKIILHKNIKDQFIERFHNSAKEIKIGHWRENVFMGPLIHQKSLDNYIRIQEIASREGAECIMRGKALEREPGGYYVSPSIYTIAKHNPSSVYEKEEIFGPSVAIYTVDELEEAFAIANSTSYGLAASFFSRDHKKFEEALLEIRSGCVNWNRPTCGASSRLPFGGVKKSGNDRPSAHFAVDYCTYPVASLEDESSFDSTKVAKGIHLK